jgi:hypothetical protein
MVDLPKGWPMFCRDLKQVAGDRKLIPQTTTEHNALTDAIWTKEAHAALSAAHAEPVAWRFPAGPTFAERSTCWGYAESKTEAERGGTWGGVDPLYTRPPSEAAIRADERAAIRREAFEEAAEAIEPKGPRPCDCDRCYCDKSQDAEQVAAWDEAMANATAIRARGER